MKPENSTAEPFQSKESAQLVILAEELESIRKSIESVFSDQDRRYIQAIHRIQRDISRAVGRIEPVCECEADRMASGICFQGEKIKIPE